MIILVNKSSPTTLKDVHDYCMPQKELGLDIETTRKFKRNTYDERVYKPGLDPYVSNILMIQIGTLHKVYIIDRRDFSDEELQEYLKPILENKDICKVGHNMAFEGIHFLNIGIRINNIWDTMMAEKVMYNGLFIKYSLEALSYRYLDKKNKDSFNLFDTSVQQEIESKLAYMTEEEAYEEVSGNFIDKSTRMQFINWGTKPFTPTQIQYGADDIYIPLKIKAIQSKGRFVNQELYYPEWDIKFESNFTQVLAQVSLNGVPVNTEKWLELYKKNCITFEKRVKILDNYVTTNHPKFTGAANLFDPSKRCLVDWKSSTSVVKFFRTQGLAVYKRSKASGNMAWTVGAATLLDNLEAKYKGNYFKGKDVEITDEHTLALQYLLLKKSEQLITTFGKEWLKYIHPITGLVHSNFNQYMITNRLSSRSPNSQQIPGGPFRDCFEVKDSDEWWLSADYAQQEIRVAAEVHNNQIMKDFFLIPNDFDNDYHSYAATQVQQTMRKDDTYRVPPKESDEHTSEHSKERNHSKTISFLLTFGGGPFTLAKRLGVTEEEAEVLFNAYFEGFTGLADAFEYRKKFILKYGYSVITSSHKRPMDKRYFFPYHERMQVILEEAYALTTYEPRQKIPDEEKKRLREETNWSELWREFMIYKGKAERRGLNTPVQGPSATMTKIAMWIIQNKIWNENLDMRLILPVHDELNAIGKKEHGAYLSDAMKQAGTYICKEVPMDAECEIAKYWKH